MSEMQSPGQLAGLPCWTDDRPPNMERRNAGCGGHEHGQRLFQQQRSTNNVSAANEGSTWTTYLP